MLETKQSRMGWSCLPRNIPALTAILLFTGLISAMADTGCPESRFMPCITQLRLQRVPFDRNILNVVFNVTTKAKLQHTCRAYADVLPCFRDRVDSCGDLKQRRMLEEVTNMVAFFCSPFSQRRQNLFVQYGSCIGEVLQKPPNSNCYLDQHPLGAEVQACRRECASQRQFLCLMKVWVSEQSLCTLIDVENTCGVEASQLYQELQTTVFDKAFPVICTSSGTEVTENNSAAVTNPTINTELPAFLPTLWPESNYVLSRSPGLNAPTSNAPSETVRTTHTEALSTSIWYEWSPTRPTQEEWTNERTTQPFLTNTVAPPNTWKPWEVETTADTSITPWNAFNIPWVPQQPDRNIYNPWRQSLYSYTPEATPYPPTALPPYIRLDKGPYWRQFQGGQDVSEEATLPPYIPLNRSVWTNSHSEKTTASPPPYLGSILPSFIPVQRTTEKLPKYIGPQFVDPFTAQTTNPPTKRFLPWYVVRPHEEENPPPVTQSKYELSERPLGVPSIEERPWPEKDMSINNRAVRPPSKAGESTIDYIWRLMNSASNPLLSSAATEFRLLLITCISLFFIIMSFMSQ